MTTERIIRGISFEPKKFQTLETFRSNKQLFESKEILLSYRNFEDYSSDLLRSDHATFNTHLDTFINFCENDNVRV